MFTGIIEGCARVLSNEAKGSHYRLQLASQCQDLKAGESIAVNGVCLTWLPNEAQDLLFDVSIETLEKTNLAGLKIDELVNIERAMMVGARFGGHIVSGHVDKTSLVRECTAHEGFITLVIAGFTKKERSFLITKGSVAVNGVSLTINKVYDDCIELMLIPHTLASTNLKHLVKGSRVNIEFDYFAKIISQQISQTGKNSDEVKA